MKLPRKLLRNMTAQIRGVFSKLIKVSVIGLKFFSSLEYGFSRGSSSPIYSGPGFAIPVTWSFTVDWR